MKEYWNHLRCYSYVKLMFILLRSTADEKRVYDFVFLLYSPIERGMCSICMIGKMQYIGE